MQDACLIEVGYKEGVKDPVGEGLLRDIQHLKLARLRRVLSAQLYRIQGHLSPADRSRIAKDLLCDPVVQEFREGVSGGEDLNHSAVIDVWYKPGVTDVVGESVLKGIRDLSVSGVQEVRTGMRYRLCGVTRRDVAEKIARSLLVNPLVHDPVISATTTSADQTKRSVRHAD